MKCEEDEEGKECYWFICDPQQLKTITEAARARELPVSSSTLEYIPKSTVSLKEVAYHKAESLVDLIHEHQDVIRVYSNFELE